MRSKAEVIKEMIDYKKIEQAFLNALIAFQKQHNSKSNKSIGGSAGWTEERRAKQAEIMLKARKGLKSNSKTIANQKQKPVFNERITQPEPIKSQDFKKQINSKTIANQKQKPVFNERIDQPEPKFNKDILEVSDRVFAHYD